MNKGQPAWFGLAWLLVGCVWELYFSLFHLVPHKWQVSRLIQDILRKNTLLYKYAEIVWSEALELTGCQSISWFLYHEAARSISISPGQDTSCRSLPDNLLGFPNNSPVPIYTPEWREALWELSVLPKNTTQWLQLGLEPRPLAPDMSELTMRVVQYRRTDKTCIMASSFLNDSYDLNRSWNDGLSCKVGGLYIIRETLGIHVYTQVHDPYTSHDSCRLWNNGLLVMHLVDCISLVWLQLYNYAVHQL